jgi:peptidoglycan/LPS O-acetylase OafA/YrhL
VFLVFQPFRAKEVGLDAFFAFVFASNWWFQHQNTDYFAAAQNTVSPLQHYWSLSIEEQFYFVWPALIALISVIVARRALDHSHRMRLAGTVMAGIVALSFAWAIYQTSTAPAAAYFDTFARVWELGVGALLACSVGVLARIPTQAKPALSWAGLALIAASMALITTGATGFPAPWALLPVAGAALVIAAGVNGEPQYQPLLTNPVSQYIGDISYSLYLVHWPIIVIAAELMGAKSVSYYATVVALAFGAAVLSYHFVETPLRRADRSTLRAAAHRFLSRKVAPQPTTRKAALAGAALIITGLAVLALTPPALSPAVLAEAAERPNAIPATVKPAAKPAAQLGPAATALQQEIAAAVKATSWPTELTPPMDEAIGGLTAPTDVIACGDVGFYDQNCIWGSPTAPFRIVVVGDSIAVAYGGPLQKIAQDSGGQIQIHTVALSGCQFSADDIYNADPDNVAACPGVKENAINIINTTKPDVVLISDAYSEKKLVDGNRNLTGVEWASGMQRIVDKFRANARKIVWLASPPADQNPATCYGKRGSTPTDCLSKVTNQWLDMAQAEQDVARGTGGVWVDSRPWFCSDGGCPAFVGTTPTKRDTAHLTKAYGEKITPVIAEALREAGALGPQTPSAPPQQPSALPQPPVGAAAGAGR